jgi:hypothetical protein
MSLWVSFSRRTMVPAAVASVLAFTLGSTVPVKDASAQVIERGVQGGVVGAIIGGIVGGGRGAGRGAAIGAGVGLVTGAAEANERARYESRYYGPPPGGGRYYGPPGGGGGSDLVFNIQESLTRLGYDPGPPDGVFGYRTAEAIREFQYDNRLPPDGRPSPQLLDYMMRRGG